MSAAGSEPAIVLRPLQQDSTPLLIARQLREAIATGQFRPGEQMLETALARTLGVSRGPLREAMQRLTQEGLLVSQRNRGLFVVDLDADAIADLYLARSAIERAAIEKILTSDRFADAARLVEITEQMASAPDLMAASALDIRFHELLVELADSPQLQRMHRTLLTQVRMCLIGMAPSYSSVQEVADEHRLLAQAILELDEPRAIALLAEHMADGLRRLVRDEA